MSATGRSFQRLAGGAFEGRRDVESFWSDWRELRRPEGHGGSVLAQRRAIAFLEALGDREVLVASRPDDGVARVQLGVLLGHLFDPEGLVEAEVFVLCPNRTFTAHAEVVFEATPRVDVWLVREAA